MRWFYFWIIYVFHSASNIHMLCHLAALEKDCWSWLEFISHYSLAPVSNRAMLKTPTWWLVSDPVKWAVETSLQFIEATRVTQDVSDYTQHPGWLWQTGGRWLMAHGDLTTHILKGPPCRASVIELAFLLISSAARNRFILLFWRSYISEFLFFSFYPSACLWDSDLNTPVL